MTNLCIIVMQRISFKFSSQTATNKLYFSYDDNDVKLEICRFKNYKSFIFLNNLLDIIFLPKGVGFKALLDTPDSVQQILRLQLFLATKQSKCTINLLYLMPLKPIEEDLKLQSE